MNAICESRGDGDRWMIGEISFEDFERNHVRDDRHLFYMLAAASFVEITSDLYTDNLVAFYQGDAEITAWLTRHWRQEELRHGAALRRYVETAWPEFDWDAGYRSFLAEYTQCCTVERLARTRALELAARCVIETGTATFYRALSETTVEPVLKRITALISADEVRHYTHFSRFFQRYQESEGTRRPAILRALWRRAAEADSEDIFLAFKHVFLSSNPGDGFRRADYDAFRHHVRLLTGPHYPHDMAVRMMLKPLALSAPVVRMLVPPMVSTTRLLFLR